MQRAFADAAVAAGHRLTGDHNEPGTVGVGPCPRNVRDGLRMSTALTRLAAVRGLPNLAIRAGAAVDRVELGGTTARGVRLADGEIVEARWAGPSPRPCRSSRSSNAAAWPRWNTWLPAWTRPAACAPA